MNLQLLQVALGLFILSTFNAAATVHYVDINCSTPAVPYTDWTTAATNIQDAVDAAASGDIVMVTNGVYQTGSTFVSGLDGTPNRVAVTKPLTLQSVNGPLFTIISGYQAPGTTNGASAVRCVYLTNGVALTGFMLTNGATVATSGGGGGVYFHIVSHSTSIVSNCVLVGNAAAAFGGGAVGGGTLINCTLTRNWARQYGGGASQCILIGCTLNGNSSGGQGGGSGSGFLTNCTLIGNSALLSGGGSYGEKLVNCTVTGNFVFGNNAGGGGVGNSLLCANCIIYFNSAPALPYANCIDATLFYSCTTPAPSPGRGNITNEPLFLDQASGNLRLQSNSPCINAGKNPYMLRSSDLEGNPRIVGGTVDIGAYEFQSPASTISYAWLQQYGLPTDDSADNADPDGDGMKNREEWIAGTDPMNALSVLMMLPLSNSISSLTVRWQSVSGITYYLQRSTNLSLQPAFSSVRSNLVGQAGTTAFTDTNAAGLGPFFYRVGVQQ